MERFARALFQPPPMPELVIPALAKLVPHARITIQKALELFYFRGLFDGFWPGLLVGLVVGLWFAQRRNARNHAQST